MAGWEARMVALLFTMSSPYPNRRRLLQMLVAMGGLPATGWTAQLNAGYQPEAAGTRTANREPGSASQAHHVQPGGNIQDALEAAAAATIPLAEALAAAWG